MATKVKYGDIWLAAGDDEYVDGFHVSGRWAVQVAELLRAASVKVFGRGNRKTEVQFSINRQFDTVAACQLGQLIYPQSLPASGTVLFYLQDGSVLTAPNAVVETLEMPKYRGLSLDISYSIIFPQIILGTVPVEDTMYSGSVNIPINADSVTITGLALPSPVKRAFVAVRKATSAGYNIFATVRNDSLSPDGFIVDLSAAPNDALTQLDYFYVI